jgi:hypothetical protein
MFLQRSKVALSKILHPVMNMNERGNLQTGYVHKINWNFGIFMVKVLFFPYKSTTCAVPIWFAKLESDWNLCAKHWNSNLLEQIPIYWNRVGILEPTSGLADALFKLPSMHTPTHTRLRARKQRTGLKILRQKNTAQSFDWAVMGENVISYCTLTSRL